MKLSCCRMETDKFIVSEPENCYNYMGFFQLRLQFCISFYQWFITGKSHSATERRENSGRKVLSDSWLMDTAGRSVLCMKNKSEKFLRNNYGDFYEKY